MLTESVETAQYSSVLNEKESIDFGVGRKGACHGMEIC